MAASTRDARCTFCDVVFAARFNRLDGQYAFPRHSHGGQPCPGSYSFVPPGAFTDSPPDEEPG